MTKLYMVLAAKDWAADTPILLTTDRELAEVVGSQNWHSAVYEIETEKTYGLEENCCPEAEAT